MMVVVVLMMKLIQYVHSINMYNMNLYCSGQSQPSANQVNSCNRLVGGIHLCFFSPCTPILHLPFSGLEEGGQTEKKTKCGGEETAVLGVRAGSVSRKEGRSGP